MTGPLYRIGGLCSKHYKLVMAAWVVVALGLALAGRAVGDRTSDNLTLPGTGSTQATDLLQAHLPDQANGTNPLVIQSSSGKLTDKKNEKAVNETVDKVRNTPHVTRAINPLGDHGKDFLSKDKETAYIPVSLDVGQGDLSEDEAQAILDAGQPAVDAGLDVSLGGYAGQQLSKPSTHESELIGLTAAVVILLFAFGTATAMALPIVTALIGLVSALALIRIVGLATDVPTVAPTLATMIGLGVGIDYALFIVTRHKLQLRDGMEMGESVARATATAGGAVLFAGTTVVIALCSLFFAGIPLVTTLGFTAAIAVVVAVLTAVTLLPALLGALGPRIHSLRVKLGRTHPDDHRPHGWARWARGVAKRPWRSVAASTAVLLILALPLLDLHLGQSDTGALPTSTTARQAYDAIGEGFGEGTNGPLLVAAELGKPAKPDQNNLDKINKQQKQLDQQQQQIEQQALLAGATQQQAENEAKQQTQSQSDELADKKKQAESPATDPRLTKLSDDMAKAPDVKSVSPPTVDKSGTAAVYTVVSDSAPSSQKTEDLVNHLRSTTIPEATKGTDMTATVGGQTAGYIDLAEPDLEQAARDDRHRRRPQLRGAHARLPVPRGAGQGRDHEPAVGGRRVRRGHLRLPGGPRRLAHRAGGRDPDRELRAAPDVRDPVRPLDGLRGVPAEPDSGALPRVAASDPSGDRGPGQHRPRDHLGRPDHGLRVHELRAQRRPGGQAIRRGTGGGDRDRRHARALPAGARGDDVARQGKLVDAVLARPASAADQHRGRGLLRRACAATVAAGRGGSTMTEVFRTPDERFDELPGYPFEPHYVEVDGLRLHHVDEGSGPPVVCFHGEPTWSYLYRHVIYGLVAVGRRVICPDLVGFGRSDKPTDPRWYSYDGHVEVVGRHLDQLDLHDVTVVVQDWGGPIGLRWAVENAERVARLVILNTGLYVGRVSDGFMQWREFAERNPDLPIGMIVQGGSRTQLPVQVVAAYDAPFPTPESKAGAARFPLLVPLGDEDPGAAEMSAVRAELARWDKPALVCFSDGDPIFPYPVAGELFTQLIPGAGEQVRLDGAAHFVQEDAAPRIVEAMI